MGENPVPVFRALGDQSVSLAEQVIGVLLFLHETILEIGVLVIARLLDIAQLAFERQALQFHFALRRQLPPLQGPFTNRLQGLVQHLNIFTV